jgi:ABC-type phosphate transport system permease subunit
MKTKVFGIMAVATVLALLAGCGQNQILATLEASVSATEVLIGALEAGGKIPPSVATEIEDAIAQLPDAYQETTLELASTDSDAVKAVTIAGYYAATLAALQVVPEEAKAYAAAIAGSIEAFLSTLAQAQTPAAHTTAQARGARKFDSQRLQAIANRAITLRARLAALKSAQAR